MFFSKTILNKDIKQLPLLESVDKTQIGDSEYICDSIFDSVLCYVKDSLLLNNLAKSEVEGIIMYRKLCYKYKIIPVETLDKLLLKYFTESGLVFYLWIRDMECHFTRYKD